MNPQAQVSTLFHLDKCIGCHTCSVACKNLWTDRRGAEYMWWNNVETRPGTGYPTGWEDQSHHRGGWRRNARGRLELSQLGVTERWYGDTEQAFPHLLHDLRSVWNRAGPGPSEAVRVYGKDGVGAVDPRTGASCARLKDALAGRLDVFLQAWRQRAAGATSG